MGKNSSSYNFAMACGKKTIGSQLFQPKNHKKISKLLLNKETFSWQKKIWQLPRESTQYLKWHSKSKNNVIDSD